jgi:hypothetical protein
MASDGGVQGGDTLDPEGGVAGSDQFVLVHGRLAEPELPIRGLRLGLAGATAREAPVSHSVLALPFPADLHAAETQAGVQDPAPVGDDAQVGPVVVLDPVALQAIHPLHQEHSARGDQDLIIEVHGDLVGEQRAGAETDADLPGRHDLSRNRSKRSTSRERSPAASQATATPRPRRSATTTAGTNRIQTPWGGADGTEAIRLYQRPERQARGKSPKQYVRRREADNGNRQKRSDAKIPKAFGKSADCGVPGDNTSQADATHSSLRSRSHATPMCTG